MLKFFSAIHTAIRGIEKENQPKYTEIKKFKEINRFLSNIIATIKMVLILLFYMFIAFLLIVAVAILIVIIIGHLDTITEIIINKFNTL